MEPALAAGARVTLIDAGAECGSLSRRAGRMLGVNATSGNATVCNQCIPAVKPGAAGLPKLSRAFESDEALAAPRSLIRVRALAYTAALGGPKRLIKM